MSGTVKPVRCAIYTRKSTEDGLEQEFNSLHAQREACEAYILSQRHEGWTLISDGYDDGGFSGGTMTRPGLQRLLVDVVAGKVDVIVVYKVDRLTRSLADFAKIVERLDEKQASFVSVTQAFNTTTSMGRLTLNVLLSFAQFEREVTGERIRDKIAASKKKGLWMGGPVPLGYIVQDRKLVIEPAEAEQVRVIMRRYIASRSANELIAELEAEGMRTKVQRQSSGPHRGGIPFRRGSLFHLLKNPIYRGLIVHKGQAYPGLHEPIVDEALWSAVQKRLATKAPPRRRGSNDRQPALLRDKVFDRDGRPMVPSYVAKGPRRYCYYETRPDLAREGSPKRVRVQMALLESQVLDQLTELLDDQHRLRSLSGMTGAAALGQLFETADRLSAQMAASQDVGHVVQKLVRAVHIGADHMEVEVAAGLITGADGDQSWTLRRPLSARKPFREAKLVIADTSDAPIADSKLVALLEEAAATRSLVLANPDLPLRRLAEREGRCRKQMTQLLKLSWLSPKISDAILDGQQPSGLTRQRLMALDLPLCWSDQEALLGAQ